jgi:hypothetical protein
VIKKIVLSVVVIFSACAMAHIASAAAASAVHAPAKLVRTGTLSVWTRADGRVYGYVIRGFVQHLRINAAGTVKAVAPDTLKAVPYKGKFNFAGKPAPLTVKFKLGNVKLKNVRKEGYIFTINNSAYFWRGSPKHPFITRLTPLQARTFVAN